MSAPKLEFTFKSLDALDRLEVAKHLSSASFMLLVDKQIKAIFDKFVTIDESSEDEKIIKQFKELKFEYLFWKDLLALIATSLKDVKK